MAQSPGRRPGPTRITCCRRLAQFPQVFGCARCNFLASRWLSISKQSKDSCYAKQSASFARNSQTCSLASISATSFKRSAEYSQIAIPKTQSTFATCKLRNRRSDARARLCLHACTRANAFSADFVRLRRACSALSNARECCSQVETLSSAYGEEVPGVLLSGPRQQPGNLHV